VQELSPSGGLIRMWGWGVDDGSNALQTCTSSCQTGLCGSGDGQEREREGMGIGASGNGYGADKGNKRIQEFSPSGSFMTKRGAYGSGAGQFISPEAVATDSAGSVYIADVGNLRIQKFDSSGAFLRTWGWGVDDGSNAFQTCTSSCQAGTSGSGVG